MTIYSYHSNIRTRFHGHICVKMKRVLIVCFPPLFSVFTKPFLAIPNLAHLFFQKDLKKTKKLNCLPSQIGVLRTFCASPFGQSKALACWQQVFFYILNQKHKNLTCKIRYKYLLPLQPNQCIFSKSIT